MSELFHYVDCGLPSIWLEGGVEVTETPYGSATSIANLDGLHHEIAMDIIASPHVMTGAEFRFIRIELDMSQRALADLIKTSVKNIQRWEKERDAKVTGPASVAVGLLYAASRSDEKIHELVKGLAALDRQIVELEHHKFKLEGEHWAVA
ncbi:putative zinc finger/helix-turn-helix protein, YgiT family [Shimia thalassica]|uniref:Putative zinc finger/helix-turn-helix protein, YgiT family n=1 Tax=Shimia thalassica TaxID=1715693 RepID=A0A0P1IA17_9RHOB|nr:transcriptional regulator [Shimia thalassica]CUJ84200.1 putative zinc finger/helix-turn-helix protein, YgiT family [Shimia thalassica]